MIVTLFQSHVYQCSVITSTKVKKTTAPGSPCEEEQHMQVNVYLIASLRPTVSDKDCVSHLLHFKPQQVYDTSIKEYYFAY